MMALGWQPVFSIFFSASVLFSGNFFRFFTSFTSLVANSFFYASVFIDLFNRH